MPKCSTNTVVCFVGMVLALFSFTKTVPAQTPDDVTRYVWDLSSLYPDDAAWETERTTILSKVKTIEQLKGTMGRNARSLADALDQISDLRSRAHKMSVYGELVSAVNVQSQTAQRHYDVGTALETQVEASISFMVDEISAIGATQLNQWLLDEPRLEVHWRRIKQSLQEAPHTLGPESQTIVRSMGRWPQLSSDAYFALLESDLGWPTIKGEAGQDVVVDNSAYGPLLRSPNQSLRIAAARAYLGRLRSFERVFGTLLTRRIEADLTIAQHRKFNDGIDALFFLRDGMSPGSYRVMIDVARTNLPTLHRYVELRRRVLGLDRMTYADLRALPPAINRKFMVRDSIEIIEAAFAPLGSQYQARCGNV